MDFELDSLDLDESAGDSNQPVPTLASELVPQLTKEKYQQLKKFKEQNTLKQGEPDIGKEELRGKIAVEVEVENTDICTDPSTQSPNIGKYGQTTQEFLNKRMKNLKLSETVIYESDEVLTKKWILKSTEPLKEQPASDSQDNSSIHTPTTQIPSICVNPPTPIGGRVRALYITPPTRSSSSSSLNEVKSSKTYTILKHNFDNGDQRADVPLIRSRSFTLEGPSEALLDHLRRQGTTAELEAATAQRQKCNQSKKLSASTTRDTVESKAKRTQKIKVQARPQATRAAAKSAAHTARNSASNKLRSPYEPKSNAKAKVVCPPKSAAPIKPPTPSTTGASKALRASKARSPLATQQQFNVCTTYSVKSIVPPNVLAKMEVGDRRRFNELLAQQQEEHNRLQDFFEAQQKSLVVQFSLGISKVQPPASAASARNSTSTEESEK